MNNETLALGAKILNTLGLLVIAYGLYVRRRPTLHMKVMSAAFGADLLNVFIVEFLARSTSGQGAVGQTMAALGGSGSTLFYVHVTASLLCILGYVVALGTGIRLHRRGVGRAVHRANAAIFLVTRLVSYVTSFWM